MTTFTVTTAADRVDAGDGALSLREAVAQANATEDDPDTILFAPSIEGRRLVLTQGQLTVTDDVRIDGDRDDNGSQVTIDGNQASRVLEIRNHTSGLATELSLEDLTMTGGVAPSRGGDSGGFGGAVFLGGYGDNRLSINGCTISDCRAGTGYGYGGGGGAIGVLGGGQVTIIDSSLTGNHGGAGGAIAGDNVTLVIRDTELSNNSSVDSGGAIDLRNSSLVMEQSIVRENGSTNGGGINLFESSAMLSQSTIANNRVSGYGGGVDAFRSNLALIDCTVAANYASFNGFIGFFGGRGGGLSVSDGSELVIRNSTITGNRAIGEPEAGAPGLGGGIYVRENPSYGPSSRLDIANSIVAGNSVRGAAGSSGPDIAGALAVSNGHNLFGSAVTGEAEGDRENVAGARVFAALDLDTGGGRLALNGGLTPTVRLRDALDNPALSGADPLDAGITDQRGVERPLPGHSNPDIGSFELHQAALSTRPSANNDVLTGTAGGDAITALAGNDLVRGLAGKDALRGAAGSDTLDGGNGDDLVEGGAGWDLLRGRAGDDRLFGSSGGDRLFAGPGDDLLRSGPGGDRLLGEAGADRFDLDPGDTGVGADRRDLILDFVQGADRIDLASIDARSGQAGDQAFAFLGTGALTGAGQLRYGFAGTSTVVQGSTDGDAAPEFEVQLAGRIALAAGDFQL